MNFYADLEAVKDGPPEPWLACLQKYSTLAHETKDVALNKVVLSEFEDYLYKHDARAY